MSRNSNDLLPFSQRDCPQEEAYIREAIKASLESEAKRQQGEKSKSPEKPKMSAEATDLLIDFMDDFDSTG